MRLLTGVVAATFDGDGIRPTPLWPGSMTLGGLAEGQFGSDPDADRTDARSGPLAFERPSTTCDASTSRARTWTSVCDGGSGGDD